MKTRFILACFLVLGPLASARAQDVAPADSSGVAAVETSTGSALESVEKAKELRRAGRAPDAEKLLRGVIARDPDCSAAVLELASLLDEEHDGVALVYFDGKDLKPGPVSERTRADEARQLLQSFPRNHGEGDLVALRLGILEARAGNDKRAIELLSSIAAVSSWRALARYDLGLVHLKTGSARDAAIAFVEARDRAKDRPEPAYLHGIASLRLGDDRGAIAAFEAAERNSQKFAFACARQLGGIHERLGELEKAVPEYERAARMIPKDAGSAAPLSDPLDRKSSVTAQDLARVEADRGRVLLRLGLSAEAAAAYKSSLDAKDEPQVRFHYGLALYLSLEKARAKEQVEILRGVQPDLARQLEDILLSRKPPAAEGSK